MHPYPGLAKQIHMEEHILFFCFVFRFLGQPLGSCAFTRLKQHIHEVDLI